METSAAGAATGALIGLAALPVIFIFGVLLSALPLHLAAKVFGVDDSTYGKALKVTLMSWLLSVVASVALGMLGFVIPVLMHFLAGIAPLAIFILMIQRTYGISTLGAVILGLAQYVVSAVLVVLAFLAMLPLGLGFLGFLIGGGH